MPGGIHKNSKIPHSFCFCKNATHFGCDLNWLNMLPELFGIPFYTNTFRMDKNIKDDLFEREVKPTYRG